MAGLGYQFGGASAFLRRCLLDDPSRVVSQLRRGESRYVPFTENFSSNV